MNQNESELTFNKEDVNQTKIMLTPDKEDMNQNESELTHNKEDTDKNKTSKKDENKCDRESVNQSKSYEDFTTDGANQFLKLIIESSIL